MFALMYDPQWQGLENVRLGVYVFDNRTQGWGLFVFCNYVPKQKSAEKENVRFDDYIPQCDLRMGNVRFDDYVPQCDLRMGNVRFDD